MKTLLCCVTVVGLALISSACVTEPYEDDLDLDPRTTTEALDIDDSSDVDPGVVMDGGGYGGGGGEASDNGGGTEPQNNNTTSAAAGGPGSSTTRPIHHEDEPE